jgi:hypothetical protein
VKSDRKECGIAIGSRLSVIKSGCNQRANKTNHPN